MYISLDKLVFCVTKACPGRCKHCQLGEVPPSKRGAIDAQRAAEALRELCARYTVDSVLIFGGEPMLYPEAAYTLARAARDCGIAGRGIISNGMVKGSRDAELAYAAGQELAASGIVNALVSVDAFHEEHIPLEMPRAFAEGISDAGANVRFHPAWVVDEAHDNPYNARTREMLRELSPLGIAVSNGNAITPHGSAARHFSEYYSPMSEDALKAYRCGGIPYSSPLDDVYELTIDPDGAVMVCGFEIGNLHTESLPDIVERYNPHENEQMAVLLRGGPYALSEWARERGVFVDISHIYTGCELCRRVTEALSAKQKQEETEL